MIIDRPLDRQIWRLAGPAFLTLAAEPLYLLVDTAVVGRLGGTALASLAVAATILLTTTGVMIFLTFGTAATVARTRGAGQHQYAAEQSVQAAWLAVGCGIDAAAMLAVTAPTLVGWLGPTGPDAAAVAAGALTYLRIGLLGVPAVCITMAVTGALRGHLDARTPLLITVAANVVNLAVEIPLVLGLGWGLAGSAIGTVAVQSGAAAAYLVVLARRHGRLAGRTRPDRTLLSDHVVVGRDLFVRTLALRASFLALTALAARKGATALAAYQVALQWWILLTFVLDGLEAAAQSLIGTALGASDSALARRTAHRVLFWSAALGALLGVATIALRTPIAELFTDDAAITALVTASLVWVGVAQPLNGLASSLDGVLVGARDQRFLAIAMVGSLAVLAACGAAVAWSSTGLWGVWLTVVVFIASRVAVLTPRLNTVLASA